MALTSLGKNAALVEQLTLVEAAIDADDRADASEAVKSEANEKLKKAKGDIQKSLTPWIPGDFIVTYGTLLTAWEAVQGSFKWLLVIGIASSFVFVWAGAFSLSGFKDGLSSALAGKLFIRSVVGAILSVFVAITIPSSGWYEVQWFVDNEQGVILTAGIITTVLVMLLTGMKMRGILESSATE